MASSRTEWSKPTSDGVYWWRLNADDTPDPVTVRGDFAYDTGYLEPTSVSLGEFLGPITVSDVEQLTQLRKAAQTAQDFIEAVSRDIHYVYSPEAAETVGHAADDALTQLRAALNPDVQKVEGKD